MVDNFKEIREFLNNNEYDIRPLLETNNFDAIYMRLYSEIDRDKLTGQFTELMLNLGINPLDYMSLVPPHFLYQTSISSIFIPKNIRYIDSCAFYYAYNLKDIKFEPSSELINVRYGAFQNCVNLKEIKFPSSVENINEYAFDGCKNLERIYVSENTQLKDNIFNNKKTEIIKY